MPETDNTQPDNYDFKDSSSSTTDGADDGGNSFLESLPEEYRNKPFIQNIKDLNGLLKSYENAQTLIGKKTIGIPDENSKPEDIENFYKKLGKPEKIDEYEMVDSYVQIFGDEKGKAFDDKFRDVFSKTNLTKNQAKDLQVQLNAIAKELETEFVFTNQVKEKEKLKELESKLLQENDDKEKITQKASKVLEKLGNKEVTSLLNGLLDDKSKLVLSSVLSKVHDTYIKDDELPKNNAFSKGNNLFEIKSEIETLFKNDAYYKPSHPNYASVREKMQELQLKEMELLKKT